MIPYTATNFLYANEKLSDYGMILCKFNNETLETISIGNNLTFNTVKSGKSDRNFLTSTTYEEPLSTTFQICKHDCHEDDKYISPEELTSLLRWLSR